MSFLVLLSFLIRDDLITQCHNSIRFGVSSHWTTLLLVLQRVQSEMVELIVVSYLHHQILLKRGPIYTQYSKRRSSCQTQYLSHYYMRVNQVQVIYWLGVLFPATFHVLWPHCFCIRLFRLTLEADTLRLIVFCTYFADKASSVFPQADTSVNIPHSAADENRSGGRISPLASSPEDHMSPMPSLADMFSSRRGRSADGSTESTSSVVKVSRCQSTLPCVTQSALTYCCCISTML